MSVKGGGKGPSEPRARARWTVEFVFIFGCWWLYVSKFSVGDAALGVCAAAIGAGLTEAFRATGISAFFPHFQVVLQGTWTVPLGVVRDCWTLLRVLVMRVFDGAPLAGLRVTGFESRRDRPKDVTRRALALALMTVSPNTIGIEIDDGRNLLLFHQIHEEQVPDIVKSMRRP